MKEITAILLTVLVFLAAFAACGRKEVEASSEGAPSSSEAATREAATEATIEVPAEPDPETPEGAMTDLLDSAKEWDAEAVEGYLPEGVAVDSYIPEGLQGVVSTLLSRTEYEVYDAETDGDAAAVEVELTAVDAEKAMGDAVTGLLADVAMKKLRGEATDDYPALLEGAVRDIDINALPTVTKTATAYMVRGEDGEWKLDAKDGRNLGFLNAVTGGAVDAAKGLAELAKTYGISLD